MKGSHLIIFRYLARQVFVSMLSVTFILLLVFMSGRFIRYLDKVASGRLSADVLFPVMAYRLPEFLQVILPLGFYIGILLAYGRMYLESEMTVLHSCGMSRNRLLKMSLSLSVLIAIFVGTTSLYATPWGFQKAKDLLTESANLSEFELLFAGRFQEQRSQGRVTYVESISDDKKTLFGVYIAETERQSQTYAEYGVMNTNETTGEKFLLLHNGTRYLGSPGENAFKVMQFDMLGVRIDDQTVKEAKSYKIAARPTSQLLSAQDNASAAELQWRLSLPFLAPIVCLLAVAFSKVNPRQGRFVHLFPAMLIYVAYLGLLMTARSKVEKGDLPPAIGMWAVHALFFVISLLMLYRENIVNLLKSKRSSVPE
ncbi:MULTISPECIES: LPS export ABC transporter permease LptF [unclassified Oleiphilus]|nr:MULTISPECIES: LPS export ABC transporter permease LptF [unclassified Oleiphilus]